MEEFRYLGETDREGALGLLRRKPEANIVMLHNILRFGIEPGEGHALEGEYFGREAEEGMVSVGALYKLGVLFFYGTDLESVEGMGDFLASEGKVPRAIMGPAAQVDEIAGGLDGKIARIRGVLELDRLVLRAPVLGGFQKELARPATISDLDAMLPMALELEGALLEGVSVPENAVRELLDHHVRSGTAFVVEVEGEILSKAEATLVKGAGAQIGGVYTVPGARGRGYSGACIEALCRSVLEKVDLVALGVDRNNAAAYGLYRKIGFEKVEEWRIVMMEPA